MDLSEKTRLEMEAGARQLAIVQGKDLSPDYMEAVIRTQAREAQLRRWVVSGKVKIIDPTRYQQGTVRYKRDPDQNKPIEMSVHVLPQKNGPVFKDEEALRSGGYPSEVLIANIALYLQSVGEL